MGHRILIVVSLVFLDYLSLHACSFIVLVFKLDLYLCRVLFEMAGRNLRNSRLRLRLSSEMLWTQSGRWLQQFSSWWDLLGLHQKSIAGGVSRVGSCSGIQETEPS